MKKAFFISLAVLASLALPGVVHAQQTDTTNYVERSPAEVRRAVSERTNVFSKTLLVEMGGPSLIMSFNYDMRLTRQLNGIGFRAGLGYYKVEDTSFFTLPLQLNYLLGKYGKYFEIGLGGTVFLANFTEGTYINGQYNTNSKTEARVLGTFTVGYRKQPLNGGFVFSAGLTSILGKIGLSQSVSFLPVPYIGFGYNF